MEEEEASATAHGTETIGWLAIEAGQGTWNGRSFEAVQTPGAVTHQWYSIGFAGSYGASRFLAAMTTKLGDNCALRYQNLTAGGVQVKVEEDTTWDTETYHWKLEAVAYLAIEGDGPLTALSGPGADSETSYYYFSGQRVAMRQDGTLYFIVGDHLGTTSAVFDAGGSLHSQSRHYPYGTERWADGAVPTEYRFTGHRYDSYTRLTVMGARWYDSQLGRWISADPVCPTSTLYSQFSLALTVSYAEASVLAQLNDATRLGGARSESVGLPVPGNPQLCNRFSYVVNNPLGFRDPSGYDPIPMWRRFAGKVCGVGGATLDTLAWVVSGAGTVLEGAGIVGIPITVGEEPLTFLGTVILYNVSFNQLENYLSFGAFAFTAAGDWLSGASYIQLNPLTVAIGQDTAVSYAAIVVGSGVPLTPEAFTDFTVNTAVLVYDYGRLLELIPTGFEIRVIGETEDGLDVVEIIPVVDE